MLWLWLLGRDSDEVSGGLMRDDPLSFDVIQCRTSTEKRTV